MTAGRQRGGRVAATDVELGRLVRAAAWSAASRTSTTGASRDQAVLTSIKANYPRALATFGRPALLALTRNLGPGACSWCAAAVLAAGDQEPAPDLDSAAHRALLGRPCARCQRRHAAGKVADRERSHLAEITAAGLNPAAAARLRSSEEVQRHARAVERLKQAQPAPAPTGIMWPASQPEPPEVTAALTAAVGRRPPTPSYYQPRPIRWPADARRPQ